MLAYKNVAFVQVIDNFMSSFYDLLGFFSRFNHKRHTINIYSFMNKVEEKVSKEEIQELIAQRVLPKMPGYMWNAGDLNIFNNELTKFFQEKELDELFSKEISTGFNKTEARHFLQEYYRIMFSEMLSVSSEQIALIRSEKLKETNLNHLKISRELIQSLEFIKHLLESDLNKINKGKFSENKIKSITNDSALIILTFLRMYSISHKIRIRKIDLAVKETNYLGMERIQAEL